jgi:subtilisin family serine protease
METVVAIAVVAVLIGLTFIFVPMAQKAADHAEGKAALVNPALRKAKRPVNRSQALLGKVVPNQYVIKFKPSVTDVKAAAKRLAENHWGKVLHVYTKAYKGCTLQVAANQLDGLQGDPLVARIDQNQYIGPCLVPTGVSRVRYAMAPSTPPFQLFFPNGLTPVLGGGTGNRNLPGVSGFSASVPSKPVAIIDTGIDSTHPELNVVLSMGFGLPDGEDQAGHGTHVAGIVGARGINVTGMFPGVPLWSLRVLDASGSGTFSQLLDALDFLANNAGQVGVANMSLGGGYYQPINDAVDACSALGVVMVAAAGNFAIDASQLSPCSAPTAICVAAMVDTDGRPGGRGQPGSFGDPDDTFTSFSDFGTTVAVIAPGEDIFSTFPVSMGSYTTLSGTSMACPHTAGMSALVLACNGIINTNSGTGNRNLGGTVRPNPFKTPADIRSFLISESVESIAGLPANGDSLSYPMITGRP